MNRVVLAVTAAAILLALVSPLAGMGTQGTAILAAVTGIALIPLVISTVRSLIERRLGVDVIALLAMAGALILREYLAGAVIAVMLAGGRALEEFAQARAQRELSALLRRAPKFAHRYEGESLTTIAIEEVKPADELLVKPGEVVPVDGVVIGATAILDEAALTGEAKPTQCRDGEPVRSGAVNAAGTPFRMRAVAASEQSTYAGIIRLVRQAQESKAPLVRLADRYAMFFLPFTLAIAGLAWIVSGDPVRALAVLVIATPCPLILAAPVALVGGISRAAHRGMIVKGGGALETMARAETLVLDKTGTVTAGNAVLSGIECFGTAEPDELLRMAASLDQVSPHVLAAPILRAASVRGLSLSFPSNVVEELGAGIRGTVEAKSVALGKASWVLNGAPPHSLRRLQRRLMLEGSSGVFVAIDGSLRGALILEDPVRSDAPFTLRSLRRAGFKRIVLLTGDHPDVAKVVGGVLGVNEVLAERSPADKVEAVRREHDAAVTVMVGDGINDAPALAAADVGVAVGARGATASSEAADVVLVPDRLDRIAELVRIATRSRRIALESIWTGMVLSMCGMGAGAAGLLTPVAGAIAQEGIDVLVILNALRALRPDRTQRTRTRDIGELGQQYRAEHDQLLPRIKKIRHLADRLQELEPGSARSELRAVHRFLADEIIPHEKAEDTTVYPAIAKLMGGEDPTAVMTRAHLEIAHMVNALGRLVEDLDGEGPAPEDIHELKRLLYGLDAVLRLHFAQEDESYLALLESRAEEAPARVLAGS